jgi:hypothetical protein
MSAENVYIFIISSEYIEYVRSQPFISRSPTTFIQQVSVAVAVCQLMPLFREARLQGHCSSFGLAIGAALVQYNCMPCNTTLRQNEAPQPLSGEF